jgi:preprotein translocase subunit SecF
MNTVQRNAFMSVVVLITAAVLLYFSEDKSAEIPWLPVLGFLAGSLIFAFASWRRAAAEPEPLSRKQERRSKQKLPR